MKAEDIIEGLNRHIESKRRELNIKIRGYFILHKSYRTHTMFKAYKEFIYDLWYISGGSKWKVFSISKVDKVLEGKEDSILRSLNIELCENLFNWIQSDYYKQVIFGEYAGNKNE